MGGETCQFFARDCTVEMVDHDPEFEIDARFAGVSTDETVFYLKLDAT
jgi:hypothetical protein